MAHASQIEFVENVKSMFPAFFSNQRVLEIGSLDINGTIRSQFVNCNYIGLDVAPGAGVDVVCEGQKYDAPSDSFDVVVSCEVMEHNPYWVETLQNMIRLLKPGGLMIMSCATSGRPEHGTSRSIPSSSPLTIEKGWEYYRNLTANDVTKKIDFSCFDTCGFATNWESYDLYFIGIKSGGTVEGRKQIKEFQAMYRRRNLGAWCRRAGRVAKNPLRLLFFLMRKTG